MFARRTAQQVITSNTDEVIGGISLPSDCTLNDIKIECSIVDASHLDARSGRFYAVEGYVLPVQDPDAGVGFDTLWDNLVPKDTDVQVMDLDTGALDTTPFFEPGEVDWTALFDVGLQPRRIYQRSKLLTLAGGGAVHVFQDNQSPFTVLWIAGDRFTIRIRSPIRVSQPSVVVFALANPALDDTLTTLETALSENKWAQIKYIDHVVERGLLHVLGIVEAGAETPWEEATALLQEYLEPDTHEQTAGRFASGSYETYTRQMYDISVPGTMEQAAISTGR